MSIYGDDQLHINVVLKQSISVLPDQQSQKT